MNDDLISRQAAIDGFYEMASDTEHLCTVNDYISFLESLPAYERKNGRWVRIEDENGDFLCWECSECRERYVMPYHRASYCPNCGAEMRGEEE